VIDRIGSGLRLQPPQELPGLGAAAPGAGARGADGARKTGPADGGFAADLKKFLGEANGLQLRAGEAFDGFVRGEVDLHQVALAQQEAGIALRLVVDMRDRLLQSYQEVMRMTM